jgi:hypothetical protein
MDVSGAEVLRQRLAQQENWRAARAVCLGQQPSIDPDGYALESYGDGIRVYRREQRLEQRNGRHEWVTQHLRKRLVDGAWEAEVVVEHVRKVA